MPPQQLIQGVVIRNLVFIVSFCLLAILAFTAQANNRIELSGVTGERKKNIELYLADISPNEINHSARFKNRVSRDIKQALRGLGYYQVVVNFEDEQDGADLILHANITANRFVFIQTNDLRMIGEAANDPLFLQLLKNAAPKKGERMHHGKYENFKKELMSLANRRGYFDATFERSQLYVRPGDRRGTIKLYFNSGPRYRFGEIKFVGSQIREPRLRSLLQFRSNDHYSARLLAEFNQALANTNWFRSIDMDADVENRRDGRVDLTVNLTPTVRNSVEAGLGIASISTDLGPRIKSKWQKPWLNDRGHSLLTDFSLAPNEQNLTASYKLPLRNVSDDFYQFAVGFDNVSNASTSTDSKELNLIAERNWLLKSGWTRNASIRWLYEDFIQADQAGTSNLILPGVSLSKGANSGGSMPTEADYYLIAAEIADQSWGSDTDFIRLRGRAGWIGTWSVDQRWLIRLDAGTILHEGVLNIPPSLRFFAGGDNSLRGYRYRTVAPTDDKDQLIGGLHLATLNLEYQHRVKDNWWLAVFSDYGSAWNERPDWKQSVGVGVRWASPIGAVRLDLGMALDSEPKREFRLHFTLGPEL